MESFKIRENVHMHALHAHAKNLREGALRGSFLIDEDGTVRHAVLNDLPLGRNIDEMLRMVDALSYHQKHGEVCPAGWKDGDTAMKESPEGVSDYLSKNSDSL